MMAYLSYGGFPPHCTVFQLCDYRTALTAFNPFGVYFAR